MNPFDIRFLCSAIPRLFPPRGGIVLRQMDGTDRAADFLLKRTENRDRGGDEIARMLGVEEQRCYERVFVYTLEANEDNTLNAFGMNDITTHDAVTERLMELANIQGTVLRNLVDLNKA